MKKDQEQNENGLEKSGNADTIRSVINRRRRVGGPGLQGVVARVPPRGATSDVVYTGFKYGSNRTYTRAPETRCF
jgi:hypothetical protein